MIFDSRSGKIKTKITGSKWFERKEDIKQMRLPQIINSLLETDMYKFSMGQTIFHQFTSYKTTWTFKCRNKDVHFTDEMVEEIKEQVQAFCQLCFTEEELEYLDNITWIKGTYVDFLRLWQPRYEEFTITTDAPCGLAIDAAGTWLNTSMYEIPVLAIVNEVYFRMAYDYDVLLKQFKRRLDEKVRLLEEDTYRLSDFSEFGLRRRLSAEAQEMAVKAIAEVELPADSHFIGTSNVYLAKKFNLKPVGTMAHEWIMCTGQGNHKHNPAYSNWYALDAWVLVVSYFFPSESVQLFDVLSSYLMRLLYPFPPHELHVRVYVKYGAEKVAIFISMSVGAVHDADELVLYTSLLNESNVMSFPPTLTYPFG